MKRVTMSRQAFIVIGALVSMVASADIPKHGATYYEAIKPEVQEAQRKGAKAAGV